MKLPNNSLSFIFVTAHQQLLLRSSLGIGTGVKYNQIGHFQVVQVEFTI